MCSFINDTMVTMVTMGGDFNDTKFFYCIRSPSHPRSQRCVEGVLWHLIPNSLKKVTLLLYMPLGSI